MTPAVARIVSELVDVLGEKLLVAALRRLLEDSRATQLKTNYEAGKKAFKRKAKR